MPATNLPRISNEALRQLQRETQMQLRMYLPDPEVWVIDGFLSDAEADALVAKYKKRTSVMGYVGSDGEVVVTDKRKAMGLHLDPDDELDIVINDRFEQLTLWSKYKTEPTSFVHYNKGGYILPHFDFLGKGQHKGASGQRVGTGVVYLNDTEGEGDTYFTHNGLRVYPKKGSLLFFNYTDDHTTSTSKHGSREVVDDEKFVLVKWFREGFNFE